jgi:hypothetical protein
VGATVYVAPTPGVPTNSECHAYPPFEKSPSATRFVLVVPDDEAPDEEAPEEPPLDDALPDDALPDEDAPDEEAVPDELAPDDPSGRGSWMIICESLPEPPSSVALGFTQRFE